MKKLLTVFLANIAFASLQAEPWSNDATWKETCGGEVPMLCYAINHPYEHPNKYTWVGVGGCYWDGLNKYVNSSNVNESYIATNFGGQPAYTPLMASIVNAGPPESGQVNSSYSVCTKNLLSIKHADVNAQEKKGGATFLMIALENGFYNIISQFDLTKYKVDLEKQDNNGDTALLRLASHRLGYNVKSIQALLGAGANIAAKNKKGQTTLMLVVAQTTSTDQYSGQPTQSMKLSLIDFLLEHRANLDTVDTQGNSAVSYAAQYDATTLLKFLSKNPNPNSMIVNKDGLTPLLLAAQAGNTDSLNVLIQNGQDALQTNKINGMTGLMYATQGKHSDVAKALVAQAQKTKNSTYINAVDSKGYSALYYAVLASDLDMVNTLLKAGADVTFRAQDGTMLLETMVQPIQKTKQVEKYPSCGSACGMKSESFTTSIGADNQDLFTTLVVAGALFSDKVLNNILSQNYNSKLKDYLFNAKTGYILQAGSNLFKIFQKTPVDTKTAIMLAKQFAPITATQEFNYGQPIHWKKQMVLEYPNNAQQPTPLMLAVGNNLPTIAVVLAQAGANPNSMYQGGQQPISVWEIALLVGNYDIVEALVKQITPGLQAASQFQSVQGRMAPMSSSMRMNALQQFGFKPASVSNDYQKITTNLVPLVK